MITREQIAQLLKSISEAHYQIHSYGWGDVPDLLAREDVIYPFLMVTPSSSNYEEGYATHTYTISIADRVLKDKANEVNVDSDTHQILLDILSQIDNLMYDDVDVVKGGTITPFFDNFRHEVTGHFADVGIRVKFAYDSCAVPSDIVPLPLPPPFECADASYRVQYVNGTLIEEGTIASGGSKTINVPNPSICDPANYEVRDADGNVLYSGTIASGGSENIVVTNSTVVVRKSDNTIISSVSVLAQGSANYQVADSVVTLTDTSAATLSTTNVKATDPATIVAPNGTLNVNKSDGALISGQVVKSGETKGYNVADSVITNDATTPTYTQAVKATENLVLPAQTIEVNTVNEGSINSVGTIGINLTDGVNPVVPNSVVITGRTVDIEVPTAPPTTGDYLVRFFDIDGTILKEEWVDSGNAATAPANPTYDPTYLTFDGWNNDFSNITHDLDVGAIYDTIDGKTYLFLKVTTVTGLQPTLQLNKSTTALLTIDWGDSTTNTTTSSGNVNITKTSAYSAVGDYVVSIECAANYGVSSGGYILGNNTTYSRTLIKAYIGANVNTFTDGFRNNTMLEICSFPNNLTSFGTNVFNACASLRHFNMPSSITSYGTFQGCRSLKTISISQGYNTIPNNCFLNCGSLQKVVFQNAATGIGISCFQDASSLESVYLPSICVTFSDSAFLRARSLTNIILPNNVAIASDCFNACLSLREITLPTGVTFTGSNHFRDCSSLSIVTINSTTLTSIPNNIFQSNLALKRLEFPNTITAVGSASFFGSIQMLEYTFNSTTPPTLADINAFNSINAACKIYVPDASVAAYKAASNWLTYANYIYPLSTKP